LKRCLPPLRQAAGLCATLARAIHHAHTRGIVHRDLKPGNVLLGSAGFAVPKITDFGLAKYFDKPPDEPLTVSGMVVGTPRYMAPDQASADRAEIGPAVDIYALGAILYELLTGRPPFQGKTALETLAQVVHDEPAPPRVLREGLPRDLETICLTCLNKEPSGRYASAAALADDLDAFLAGGSIQARPAGWGLRLRPWPRRRPGVAVALALAVCAGLGLMFGAFWLNGLVVAALVALGLLAGAGWYSARLQSALQRAKLQHLRAERNAQRLCLLLETTQQLV